MINIAIMGYGTIGSGVAEIIEKNKARLQQNAGDELYVKYVLDVREFDDDPIYPKIIHDYMTIAFDSDIRVVVETMGGVEPAYTFVKEMLEHGKHVVTSNKALVADKGPELIAIAEKHKVNFLFEASVGGGIPIIRPLLTCITGDEIDEISGIINGTTNFILTQMRENGAEFDAALSEAQALGYAERDPSADIEGTDACRKIAILTAVVLGQQVNYADICTEGITKLSTTDMAYAAALGMRIKLLAKSVRMGDCYAALVAPFLVDKTHPLYPVDDVFNAILVKGNMLGDAMFYGSGAGKLPTASAVVGDIVDIAHHIKQHIPLRYDAEPAQLVDHKTLVSRFFVRSTADEATIRAAFGDDIERIITLPETLSERGFLTAPMSEAAYEAKAAALDVIGMIRCA